jgi:hypothetical protein
MPKGSHRYFEESGQSLEGISPDHPEFAARVRSKIGGEYQHLVNPETIGLASLIGDPRKEPSTVYGLNVNKDQGNFLQRIINKINSEKEFGKYFKEMDADRPAIKLSEAITNNPQKRLFAFGTKADPAVWSHEFRHEDIRSEEENRIQDLLNSTSYPDYKNKINMWYRHIPGNWDKKNVPFDKQEKTVLEHLDFSLPSAIQSYLSKQANRSTNFEDAANFLTTNMDLNRYGAVGAFDSEGKILDKSLIKARSDIPLLNFIGRIDSSSSEKKKERKASGGNVERVYYSRKLI